MPKVSIIIPVYNVEKYLRECLDSVINQTLNDIEIICVNDGSTDNSLNILKEYVSNDNRIKIVNQENKGAGAARNQGIKIASGEYIIFLDGDDFFDLRMLEKLYNKSTETNAGNTVCEFYNYNQLTSQITRGNSVRSQYLIPYTELFSYRDCPDAIFDVIMRAPWNKLFKADFIRKNHFEFQNLPYFNDVYFNTVVLACANSIAIINDALLYYRININNSATSKKFTDFKIPQMALNKVNEYCAQMDNYTLLKGALINFNLNFCRYCLNSSQNPESYETNLLQIKTFLQTNNLFENITESNTCSDLYKFYAYVINTQPHSKCKQNNIKNILRTIFEIKNINIHKQITFLGFKFKIKMQKYIQKQKELEMLQELNNISERFESQKNLNKALGYKVKENSVLIVEPNDCHGEVIPGFVKYFEDLGFNVDIIITPEQNRKKSLCMYEKRKDTVFILNRSDINTFLHSKKIDEYKYILFTSHIMYERINYIIYPTIFQHFPVLESLRNKLYVVEHRYELADKQLLGNKHIIMLTKLPCQKDDVICANPHYFGDITITSKNPTITNFIMVGAIEPSRRNLNLLTNAVTNLVDAGIKNFSITVIGRGELNALPKKIRPYFNILGQVDYEVMYQEMEIADFFLPLLDPDNKDHDRYITVGTSGSFQLIYGFQKPCLIAKKFATMHGFNETNSIIYDKNINLTDAMSKAISMNTKEYTQLQDNLKEYEQKLYKNSLSNLRYMLENEME